MGSEQMYQLVPTHKGKWIQTWAISAEAQFGASPPPGGCHRRAFGSRNGWLQRKKRKEKQDWCLLTALGFSAGLNRLLLTFTSWASRGCLFWGRLMGEKLLAVRGRDKNGNPAGAGSCQGQILGRIWLKLVNIFILKTNATQGRVVYLHLC